MSVRISRVVAAGAFAAAAVAIPVAAVASGSDSPPTKPSPMASHSGPLAKPAPAASNPAGAAAAKAAAAASNSAGAAGKAAAAASGSAVAAAKAAAARAGSATGPSMNGPVAVAALARDLRVSTGAARQALQQIAALSSRGRVEPTTSAFAAIARGLGVSPAQLADALGVVKQSLAGH